MFKAVEDVFDNMHAGADEPMGAPESSTNSLETYVNPDIDREETQPVVEVLEKVAEQVTEQVTEQVVDVVTALENTLGGVITEISEIPVEIKEELNSEEKCECDEAKSEKQSKKITRIKFFHSLVDELVNYFFSCSSRLATVEILLESSMEPQEVEAPKVEKSISDKKRE